MPGTKLGGQHAAETNKRKFGEDYYAKIGAIGGKKSRAGGFAHMKIHNPERLSELGRRGGIISRKGSR